MYDLNSTMFFKAKFSLISESSEDDLLWILVMHIKKWLCKKLNRSGHSIVPVQPPKWTSFKFGGKLFDLENSNLFFAKSEYYVSSTHPNEISWACKIEEKPRTEKNFAPREWITEIGFQSSFQGSAIISFVVSYNDKAGFIGELQPFPQLTLHGIIRQLISDPEITCKIGNLELNTNPTKLNPGDFPKFKEVLFNKSRELPIVYISPYRTESGSGLFPTASLPFDLAECIAANALVYYSDDLDFSDEMYYLCDERYLCSNGSIRLYLPGIDPCNPTDQYRHRYISLKQIFDMAETNGERKQKILEIFRRALAQDVHHYDTLFRLENCQDLKEKDERLKEKDERQQKIDQSEADYKKAYYYYEEECNKRTQAEKNLADIKEENHRLDSVIQSLRQQIDYQQTIVDKYKLLEASSDKIRNIREYPSSPKLIAKYFETVYPDRIAFTDRAYRSLEFCTTKLDFLWDAFFQW